MVNWISIDNNWIEIDINNDDTFPDEGINVVVTDGMNYDIAYYLRSSEYVWMKEKISDDDAYLFKEFIPTKWKHINKIKIN